MASNPEYSLTDERAIHDSDDYDTETVTKASECHSDNLLASQRKLKNYGELCDVTIKSGEIEIKAHRFVLASATDYFKAMFLNETKEAETGVVNFPKTLPEVVKQCIDFVYSGKVEISMKIARDLLDASEMMQLPELSKLCVEYLTERVDMKNCADIISLSHLYSKDSPNESLMTFLRAHFKELNDTDAFTCFTFGALTHCYQLLGKGDADREEEKWFAILKWIETDSEERKCHFADLFTLMDLSVIPNLFVKQHISNHPFVIISNQCVRLVLENVLEDDSERTSSTILSFETGKDLISSCSVRENPPVRSPVKISFEMDVLQHRGNIFVGTGLKIYAYLNEAWYSKDVDFTKVRRTRPCVTCPNCHEDHWYVGSDSDLYKLCRNVWMTRSFPRKSFYLQSYQSLQCQNCKKSLNKLSSDESCYNRCVGVGDSVYMLTTEYIVEYNISTSQIVHHDVSIRLGNGFTVAASRDHIYAVGGNRTECQAVAVDLNSKSVTRLKNTNYSKSFGRAILDNARLHTTKKSLNLTEYYDFC